MSKENSQDAVHSLNFIEEIIEADLQNGKYKSILTRFPPEPNGYLHIGHAKAICLNFGLGLKYGGKTNIRFLLLRGWYHQNEDWFCHQIFAPIQNST